MFILLSLTKLLSVSSRPGLLASIAESIADVGLSVENVHSAIRRGPDGRLDFVCEIDCVAPTYMDKEEIHAVLQILNAIKDQNDLDVCDIRIQRLPVEDEC